MRAGLRRRVLGMAVALAAPLALSCAGTEHDAKTASASQAPVCKDGPAGPGPRAAAARARLIAARADGPEVVPLNGRGYNYSATQTPPPEAIRRAVEKAQAERRR